MLYLNAEWEYASCLIMNEKINCISDWMRLANLITWSLKECRFTGQTEAANRAVLLKQVLSKMSQNSRKNTCARVSFLKKRLRPGTLLKKRLWYRCFPVKFAKFPRTSFLQSTSRRLLLDKIFSVIKNQFFEFC